MLRSPFSQPHHSKLTAAQLLHEGQLRRVDLPFICTHTSACDVVISTSLLMGVNEFSSRSSETLKSRVRFPGSARNYQILWMQCNVLWIKASAKCIHVNIIRLDQEIELFLVNEINWIQTKAAFDIYLFLFLIKTSNPNESEPILLYINLPTSAHWYTYSGLVWFITEQLRLYYTFSKLLCLKSCVSWWIYFRCSSSYMWCPSRLCSRSNLVLFVHASPGVNFFYETWCLLPLLCRWYPNLI